MQKLQIHHALCVIVLVFICGTSSSTDRYVVEPGTIENGKDVPPYNTWTNAATNIEWAVSAAVTGETVWVSNGNYSVTNQIVVSNKVILRSVNGYSNTLVYADWPAWTTRCFYVTSTGMLDGFAVSNGHFFGSNDYRGGGGAYITNYGTIQNCYFVKNICSNSGDRAGGGGVFAGAGGIISNCLFFANKTYKLAGAQYISGLGGGICLIQGGKVLDCSVISNYSTFFGGGIYASASLSQNNIISNSLVSWNTCGTHSGGGMNISGWYVNNCVFSNNTANGDGGGIWCQSIDLRNSVIVNNYGAWSGGGIYSGDGNFYGADCVVAGNSSGGQGGGMYIITYSRTKNVQYFQISNNISGGGAGGGGICITNGGQISNCLIHHNTNNSSAGNGGGILLGYAAQYPAQAYGLINCTIVNNYSARAGGGIAALGPANYIVNCIIANNTAVSNDFRDIYNAENNTNNYFYSCANPTSAPLALNQGNITNNPMLVDSSAGNWRLQAGSPCINTGTNQSWMASAVDLAGYSRLRFGRVDMGAFEWYPRIKVNGVPYEKIRFINGTTPPWINGI